MNDFWKSVLTGAAAGATIYGVHEALGRDASLSFGVFVGPYGRQGGYHDAGWSHRSQPAYPRVCDWGFSNGTALDAWAFRRGFEDGFQARGQYNRLPPYQGQYVPWW